MESSTPITAPTEPAAGQPAGKKSHISNKIATGLTYATSAVLGGMMADNQLKNGAYKSAISGENFKNRTAYMAELKDKVGEEKFDRFYKRLSEIQDAYYEEKTKLIDQGVGQTQQRGQTSKAVRELNKKYRKQIQTWFEEHNLNRYNDYWNLMTDSHRTTGFLTVATVVGIILAAGLTLSRSESLRKLSFRDGNDAGQTQER